MGQALVGANLFIPKWREHSGFIECYQNGTVVFSDTTDHWHNALCRLLNLSDGEAKNWVCAVLEQSVCSYGRLFVKLSYSQKLEILRKASYKFFKIYTESVSSLAVNRNTLSWCRHNPDIEWVPYLWEDRNYAVIGCSKCVHGWLAPVHKRVKHIKNDALYDREYFEGNKKDKGYGNYLQQMPWRIEKSHRLLGKIEGVAKYLNLRVNKKPRALDIGSGYGFFRKILDEARWCHDGIEVSRYAAEVCKQTYGYDTFVGLIGEYRKRCAASYDLITLWDVIEHLKNPVGQLKNVFALLKDRGICVIRTPNLMAAERDIFGPRYHSLKREHLHYFSPGSIVSALNQAGLKTLFLTSESHLLSGFFGVDFSFSSCLLKGSDIFVVAGKKGQ
jgi:2-polyprenyl-3-methyl-5-hydroxy-6-metoxy-1,4-benzoquinol methylase